MPVQSHELIYEFWASRHKVMADKEALLRDGSLPVTVLAVQATQKMRGTIALQIEQQEKKIGECRKKLNSIPMPADSAAILGQWEQARAALAQLAVDRITADLRFVEASAKLANENTQLSHCAAEKLLATSRMKTAEAQKLALQALFEELKKPVFAASIAAASNLQSNTGQVALGKVIGAIPVKISDALASRLASNATLENLRSVRGSFAPTRSERMQIALQQRLSSAQYLVANAQSILAEAQTSFAQMLLVGGNDPQAPLVVSTDQREKLDNLVKGTASANALSTLSVAEQALFDRDAAKAALLTKSLDWLQPGEEGHVPGGPDVSAEGIVLAEKTAAYDLIISTNHPDLAKAVNILAQVPDAWCDMMARHARLSKELQALAMPLGQASLPNAVLRLEETIGAVKDQLVIERDGIDKKAAYAWDMAHSRAVTEAYLVSVEQRSRVLTGGISA